jgi:hypothetical protein
MNYYQVGNGWNNCHHEITIFDENSPNGYVRQKAKDVAVSQIYADNPYTITTCILDNNFIDLNGDGLTEIVALDDRFGYRFSSGAMSIALERVMKVTPTGLVDVSSQHQGFLRKQAEQWWNHVLELSRSELSRTESNIGEYYLPAMTTYAALKSLLGEYQQAKSLIKRRIQIDNLSLVNSGYGELYNIPDVIELFLRDNGYIKDNAYSPSSCPELYFHPDYEQPSEQTRRVKLHKFGLEISVPENYRVMLRNDGRAEILDPNTYASFKCSAENRLFAGGGGYASDNIELIPRNTRLSLLTQLQREYPQLAIRAYSQGVLSGYIILANYSDQHRPLFIANHPTRTNQLILIHEGSEIGGELQDLLNLLSRLNIDILK